MEKTDETYRVHRVKNNIINIKEFDNFEEAFAYLQKDKKEYDSGRIIYSYKISEEYYPFDNRNNPRPDEIDLLFDGHID